MLTRGHDKEKREEELPGVEEGKSGSKTRETRRQIGVPHLETTQDVVVR